MRVALMMGETLVFSKINQRESIVVCDKSANDEKSEVIIVRREEANELAALFNAFNCATNNASQGIIEDAINEILGLMSDRDEEQPRMLPSA